MKKDGEKAKQLLLQIQGGAGVGKSTYLMSIAQLVEKEFGATNPNFMMVGAPTGTASFNVNGTTIHQMFQLPVPPKRKWVQTYLLLNVMWNIYKNISDPAPELVGEALSKLQHTHNGCQLYIFDERSMISTTMLKQIDIRLRQANPINAHLPFGGKSIILMGDFAQLPPVNEKALYDVS